MKLSLNVVFFGWCLARQCWISRAQCWNASSNFNQTWYTDGLLSGNKYCGGQSLSTPLISTNISGMAALGEDITFFCRSRDNFHGNFYLTKSTSPSDTGGTVKVKEAESNQAAFSFSHLNKSEGGMYSCRSCLDGVGCSPLCAKIYLNLTDPSLNKPSIRILNAKDRPFFSIRCNGRKFSLTFALMNSRQQIQYKAAEPRKKSVDFYLHWTRLKEEGSFTCQYHLESNPFVWSVPSDPLVFPLRDPEMMNPKTETIPGGSGDSDPEMMNPNTETIPEGSGDSVILSPYLWAGIGVSVFLIIVLLLAVVLYRRRRKSSKTNEHNPAMNLSSDIEEHPDEVSYAILNHQPQKTQQATNPRQTSEPCLYASVVKNTSFQPYMP